MRLGTSWCLLTIGAVLAFAVNLRLDAVDLAMVGRILVVVGVTGAVIELALVRPRARAARAAQTAAAQHTLLPRTPQASWSSWDTRELTPVQPPRREA